MHCGNKGSASLGPVSWTTSIKLDRSVYREQSPPTEGQNPLLPHCFLCVQVQTSTSTFAFLTWTFPLTKVVMSFSFSKMESVCSRLCSSHSQCSVISLREVPGGKVLDINQHCKTLGHVRKRSYCNDVGICCVNGVSEDPRKDDKAPVQVKSEEGTTKSTLSAALTSPLCYCVSDHGG